MRGDLGVGTFGGSEDHTAIILGSRDELLFCQYCPTKILKRVSMPAGYSIIVAYSGKRAEKTKDAMEKYNRLSGNAAGAVQRLNELNGTSCTYLRDLYPDLPIEQRADAAKEQLGRAENADLVGRAYQFFREQDIIHRAVVCLERGRMGEYGALINESHELSRKYLKNIADEIDVLQKEALGLGALGATGFGGGFGGSCYALIGEERARDFLEKWSAQYLDRFPAYRDEARFDIYPPCSGAAWESHEL
jgi:galactokinase